MVYTIIMLSIPSLISHSGVKYIATPLKIVKINYRKKEKPFNYLDYTRQSCGICVDCRVILSGDVDCPRPSGYCTVQSIFDILCVGLGLKCLKIMQKYFKYALH